MHLGWSEQESGPFCWAKERKERKGPQQRKDRRTCLCSDTQQEQVCPHKWVQRGWTEERGRLGTRCENRTGNRAKMAEVLMLSLVSVELKKWKITAEINFLSTSTYFFMWNTREKKWLLTMPETYATIKTKKSQLFAMNTANSRTVNSRRKNWLPPNIYAF